MSADASAHDPAEGNSRRLRIAQQPTTSLQVQPRNLSNSASDAELPNFSEDELLDRMPFNEMFSDDALQHGRRYGVIPRAFRINNCDRSLGAYAQAVGFGAINHVFGFRETEFF